MARGPKRKIRTATETDGAGTENQSRIPQGDAPVVEPETTQTAVDSMVEQTATAGASASKATTTQSKVQPEIATQDTWKYHPDHEPRIFRAGDPIPKGWTGPKGIVGKIWRMDPFGKWHRVTEEKPK